MYKQLLEFDRISGFKSARKITLTESLQDDEDVSESVKIIPCITIKASPNFPTEVSCVNFYNNAVRFFMVSLYGDRELTIESCIELPRTLKLLSGLLNDRDLFYTLQILKNLNFNDNEILNILEESYDERCNKRYPG